MEEIIVSRHPAAVEFVARWLMGRNADHEVYDYDPVAGEVRIQGQDVSTLYVPVLASVTVDQVVGKRVYGNLPLAIAARAREFYAIEFENGAPRGAEYSLEDMDAAGARLVRYWVCDWNPYVAQEALGIALQKREDTIALLQAERRKLLAEIRHSNNVQRVLLAQRAYEFELADSIRAAEGRPSTIEEAIQS